MKSLVVVQCGGVGSEGHASDVYDRGEERSVL